MLKCKDQPIEKQLKNNRPNKADIVFNKLLAKHGKPKNPFDVLRSYTPPSMKRINAKEIIDDGL